MLCNIVITQEEDKLSCEEGLLLIEPSLQLSWCTGQCLRASKSLSLPSLSPYKLSAIYKISPSKALKHTWFCWVLWGLLRNVLNCLVLCVASILFLPSDK